MSIRTRRNSRRLIAAAAAVAVAASTFIATSAGPAGATGGTAAAPGAERLAGADRFATAAAVAIEEFEDATDVIVVNGRNFPDGIAASALSKGAIPILLTEQDSIPQATVDAIEAMEDLAKVWVVGGTAAVSANVLGQLADLNDGLAVERVAGADRYETAIAVATAASVAATTTAIIATGENFADALAASSLVGDKNAVILLNNGATLRSDVADWLEASNVTAVLVVGGTAAVPAAVMTAAGALKNGNGAAISTTRLGGANRYETAVAISASISAATATQGVVIVNGLDFADAISAGPLAIKKGASLLLTLAGSIPDATADWHVDNADTLKDLWVVGGTNAVSAAVATGAVAAATPAGPVITGASLLVSTSAGSGLATYVNAALNTTASAISPNGAGTVTFTQADDASNSAVTVNIVKGAVTDGLSPNVTVAATGTAATGGSITITLTASATTGAISDIWGAATTDPAMDVARSLVKTAATSGAGADTEFFFGAQTGNLTLSLNGRVLQIVAKAGSNAEGSGGNGWTVKFEPVGTTTLSAYVTAATRTVLVEGRPSTPAQIAAALNANATFAALFTATAGTPSGPDNAIIAASTDLIVPTGGTAHATIIGTSDVIVTIATSGFTVSTGATPGATSGLSLVTAANAAVAGVTTPLNNGWGYNATTGDWKAEYAASSVETLALFAATGVFIQIPAGYFESGAGTKNPFTTLPLTVTRAN